MAPIDQSTSAPDAEEIEIRLSDIVQFLKDSRWRMMRFALLGLIIGVLYALMKPNLFTSQITVLPEVQAKGANLSGLSSLAGLAGINVDGLSGPDAVRPDLYPTVLQSVPFGLYLLKQPVQVPEEKKTMAFGQYLDWSADQSVGGKVGNALFGWMKSDDTAPIRVRTDSANIIQLTKKQEAQIKTIGLSVTGEYDKKTGVITLTSKMPNPTVAAQTVEYALKYLTDYMTNYRTGKARNQVQFLENQVQQAKGRYQRAEYALSSFRDQNRSLYLQTAKIDEQRLQADFLLTQGLYNELAKQLEQARIKVQEDAPVFEVLEPAQVPLRKSEPKRTFIVLGFTVAGALLGLGLSLWHRIRLRHLHPAL